MSATLVFDDGERVKVTGAWATCTDPAYAPQILNVVSLWDDVYDVWVRELGLVPEVYDAAHGGWQRAYRPFFDDQIAPIFKSASLQGWVSNLSAKGMDVHGQFAAITAADNRRRRRCPGWCRSSATRSSPTTPAPR